jgi:hypothetical protein
VKFFQKYHGFSRIPDVEKLNADALPRKQAAGPIE